MAAGEGDAHLKHDPSHAQHQDVSEQDARACDVPADRAGCTSRGRGRDRGKWRCQGGTVTRRSVKCHSGPVHRLLVLLPPPRPLHLALLIWRSSGQATAPPATLQLQQGAAASRQRSLFVADDFHSSSADPFRLSGLPWPDTEECAADDLHAIRHARTSSPDSTHRGGPRLSAPRPEDPSTDTCAFTAASSPSIAISSLAFLPLSSFLSISLSISLQATRVALHALLRTAAASRLGDFAAPDRAVIPRSRRNRESLTRRQ